MREAISQYRIMWILVFFDLPTNTKKQMKAASKFRKDLQKDGFTMFQFSIYIRHCMSMENAKIHEKRIRNLLPEHGFIAIITITDKQFGMMKLFYGKSIRTVKTEGQQLELF